MRTEEKKEFDLRIIPRNEMKCVWMELGQVSYKICDRSFECESCPLDQGLRGKPDHTKDFAVNHQSSDAEATSKHRDSSLSRMMKLKLDESCYVHPGHTWIKVLESDKVMIGIDDIVAITLGSIDEVILSMPQENIKQGMSCGQVIQFDQIFSIVSPLSGQIVEVNKDLASFPNELVIDPLNNGWMFIVKPENLDKDLKFCRSQDALFAWYLKEYKWLEHTLAQGLQQHYPNVGMTLNDGGEISRNLRNFLPREQYRKLVLSLLGVPASSK
jgi:glycine cleavage system H protein